MISPLVLLTFSSLASAAVPSQLYSGLIPTKVLATARSIPPAIQYPQYTTQTGTWLLFNPDTWTSGFFPVTLYALNERKNVCGVTSANGLGIANWLSLGRSLSAGLLPLTNGNGQGHDQGFLSFAFGEELKLNPSNTTAQNAINKFANILAARYVPTVKSTRSWGNNGDATVQVIIDNMMNLELLFQSAELTGNATLRTIAINTADTTIANHIRSDGGTWHVVEYSLATGVVTAKHTAQGYADSSTWSRGQAWGIYGFATMFKLMKKDPAYIRYLQTARRLANYFIDNMPSSNIVPWDFNAPAPKPADSSAATIAANGLLLLADVETDSGMATYWRGKAIGLLDSMTGLAWNPSWQSLLSNGTVNRPANNQLTGTVYGDYYYIIAGTKLVQLGLASCY